MNKALAALAILALSAHESTELVGHLSDIELDHSVIEDAKESLNWDLDHEISEREYNAIQEKDNEMDKQD